MSMMMSASFASQASAYNWRKLVSVKLHSRGMHTGFQVSVGTYMFTTIALWVSEYVHPLNFFVCTTDTASNLWKYAWPHHEVSDYSAILLSTHMVKIFKLPSNDPQTGCLCMEVGNMASASVKKWQISNLVSPATCQCFIKVPVANEVNTGLF